MLPLELVTASLQPPRYPPGPNQQHCLEDPAYRIACRREKKLPHSTLFDLQKCCDATPAGRTISNAIAPAMCGVAMDVPLRIA